jgi:hypothetical protein
MINERMGIAGMIIGKGNPKYPEMILSHCHFVSLEFRLECPGI